MLSISHRCLTKITWCKFEKVGWQQWQEQTDSDYRYDERSWKRDSNEGNGASLNRKKPCLSGQLHAKNRGSTRKHAHLATMDVAVL